MCTHYLRILVTYSSFIHFNASQENPNDDEDGDILHRSGLVHNSTPELPAIVSMPNVSSISISPLTPLQGEDVNPSTDSPRYPPMVREYLPNFVALAGKRSRYHKS